VLLCFCRPANVATAVWVVGMWLVRDVGLSTGGGGKAVAGMLRVRMEVGTVVAEECRRGSCRRESR
jgi:hypothetical protein